MTLNIMKLTYIAFPHRITTLYGRILGTYIVSYSPGAGKGGKRSPGSSPHSQLHYCQKSPRGAGDREAVRDLPKCHVGLNDIPKRLYTGKPPPSIPPCNLHLPADVMCIFQA